MLNFKKIITKETQEKPPKKSEIVEAYLKVRKDKLKEFNLEEGLPNLIVELGKTPNKPA